MTTPAEKTNAMKRVNILCNTYRGLKKAELRDIIGGIGRHYPSDYEIDMLIGKHRNRKDYCPF